MRQTRTRTRAAALAVTVLGAATLAACGGSDSSSSSAAGAAGTEAKASAAVPADAIAFGSANIDTSSDAWKNVQTAGAKFPGWADLVAQFQASLNEQGADGTSFETDVRPWLGGEVGVAVLSVDMSNPDEPTGEGFVYVESKDDAKLTATVAKESTPLPDYEGYKRFANEDGDSFAAIGEGAMLVATSEAALSRSIDVRAGKGEALEASEAFKETMAALPEDNVAVGYVNGAKVRELATMAAAMAPQTGEAAQQAQIQQALQQLDGLVGIGMSVGAEDDGFRFRTAVKVDEGMAERTLAGQEPFEPTFAAYAPADALAFIDFRNLGPSLKTTLDQALAQQPQAQEQLTQVEQQTGLSLERDIIPLLSGEHALYVAPGAIPTAALLLAPESPDQGAATIRKVTGLLAGALQGSEAQIADIPGGQKITTPQLPTPLVWRQAGDVIALSNSETAGDKPASGLDKAERYSGVLEAAGVGDEVTALAYVDVPGVLQVAQSTGAQLGERELANLQHVGAIVAWGTVDGDTATSDLFVQVQ